MAVLATGGLLNPFQLGVRFWVPTVVIGLLFYPVNTFLYLQAIKYGELSKVMPVQNLGPAVALLLAFITIGERPALLNSIGMVIIMSGLYILNINGRMLHNPLRALLRERSSFYMFCSVICVGLAAVLDKVAIAVSNPAYYSFVSTIVGVVVLMIVARLSGVREIPRRKKITVLCVMGTLQGVACTAYLAALSLGPVAYVASVKSSNTLLSVMVGILYFKERLTMQKIFSLLLISVGSYLLVIN